MSRQNIFLKVRDCILFVIVNPLILDLFRRLSVMTTFDHRERGHYDHTFNASRRMFTPASGAWFRGIACFIGGRYRRRPPSPSRNVLSNRLAFYASRIGSFVLRSYGPTALHLLRQRRKRALQPSMLQLELPKFPDFVPPLAVV